MPSKKDTLCWFISQLHLIDGKMVDFYHAPPWTQENCNVSLILMLWLQQFKGAVATTGLFPCTYMCKRKYGDRQHSSACLLTGEKNKMGRKLQEHSGSWMLKCEKWLCSVLPSSLPPPYAWEAQHSVFMWLHTRCNVSRRDLQRVHLKKGTLPSP